MKTPEILILEKESHNNLSFITDWKKVVAANLVIIVDNECQEFTVLKNRWGKDNITHPLSLLSKFIIGHQKQQIVDNKPVITKFDKYTCIDNRDAFRKELRNLINTYSMENYSNTPDYVLAAYLSRCLEAFNLAANERNFASKTTAGVTD